MQLGQSGFSQAAVSSPDALALIGLGGRCLMGFGLVVSHFGLFLGFIEVQTHEDPAAYLSEV